MKKVLAAAKELLADIAQLSKPTLATAIAGLVLPVLSAFGVVDLTAGELAADLALAGMVAGTLEKLLAKRAPAEPTHIVVVTPTPAVAPPATPPSTPPTAPPAK